MEISDYVKLVKHRARPLVLAVLLAVVVAGLIVLIRPTRYQATATVLVPLPSTTTSIVPAVSQAVSDVEGTVASRTVAQRVADQTGLSAAEIQENVTTTRVGNSRILEVKLPADTPERAEEAVRAMSQEALSVLLTARLAPYEQLRDLAEQDLDAATQEYQAFLERAGVVEPESYFARQQVRLTELRDHLGAAEAQGDDARAAELTRILDEKVTQLAPLQAEFQKVRTHLSTSRAALVEAEDDYRQASAALGAAQDDAGLVSVSSATSMSKLQGLAGTAVSTAILATLLLILVVVLLEAWPGRSRRRHDRPAAPRVPARLTSKPARPLR